jgi:Mn2+/Fe2+ NRAMP family transporter
MLLIMRLTGNRALMGEAANGRAINVLGWATTAAVFAATAGWVITWFI